MATINGVQIKSLKKFLGHEGETCFQGNIYFNGKKLGFWSQSSYGGCDNYDFDTTVLEEAVKDFKDSFHDSFRFKEFIELDYLLMECVQLQIIEKQYKKFIKKGYHAMIVLFNRIQFTYLPVFLDDTEDNILSENDQTIQKITEEMGEVNEIMIFHDKDNFKYSFDKHHPAFPYMSFVF